jgi:hypothetical protein
MASKKLKNEKIINLFGEEVSEQVRYLDEDNPWDEWNQMPKYEPSAPECFAQVKFTFKTDKDVEEFGKLMEINLTDKTKSTWYPKRAIDDYSGIRYVSDYNDDNTPQYPIYIVSKGRFEKRPTSDSLCKMKVPHYIVVEEHQYDDYVSRVDQKFVTVIILEKKYLDEYDTFDDLGNTKSKGPGAARNFAWEHSMKLGFKRHWVMDDNIQNFYRLDGSKRTIVASGAIFRAMENHTERYDNVYMSGPHYRFFNPPHMENPPFWLNTRIYSCNLILNDIPYRWRGRYNEDTDLSLRILKDGHCTIQYNAFLQGKMATQAMAGGNTKEFYSKEGTKPKSDMLEEMHPDVARVVWMNQRWHHWVDYSVYKKQRLIRNTEFPIGNYEYGMEFKKTNDVAFDEEEED